MAFIDLIRGKWVARNPLLIFLLGFFSSVMGALTAYALFPENVGLMGLAFLSLILQPFVVKLISSEQRREYGRKHLSRRLFADHSQTFSAILLLFFGILFAYGFMYMYSKEVRAKELFGSQLSAYITSVGGSISPVGRAAANDCSTPDACFLQYFSNNTAIMVWMLMLSLFYGAGAMLFLAWNASVWGTYLGYIAKQLSAADGSAKMLAFLAIFGKIFPHTLFEASAYFIAVIAGLVMTKALINESYGSPRFAFVLKDGLAFFLIAEILVAIGAFVEAYAYPLF